MILVDTSVWINHFNGVMNAETSFLANGLDINPRTLAINATILQEVLQGAKSDGHFHVYEIVLANTTFLQLDLRAAAINAAQLYRGLRKKGVTIRKPNDCLIAYYALHFNIELCHNDVDFDLIAAHNNLKIWQP
ncbi:MAG: PIN domain nuclease [Runella slithyformis]|jgi:predicted nucleic acid-binding protein|nr:MAG: PIN domain nuclease [Runella slithyformis]TAF97895.1 MAG: PIN domain nuclease [Runella sp.]TAG24305.1 MAG: PIN domain nuclease [Cytophagales bacterium]TAG38970.1 MAG: PIN domain nuclease [Cytophagia bacterium]TAE96598.1 MAG: PIN domain nuclease [Runella slithyformis]